MKDALKRVILAIAVFFAGSTGLAVTMMAVIMLAWLAMGELRLALSVVLTVAISMCLYYGLLFVWHCVTRWASRSE